MAPKNIIVCADGTGNKGGYSPDSNVYKVYKAVDKYFSGECDDKVTISEQIIFYDNGVGTAKNKLIRSLSGAVGFGFRQNVCDLYKFLARNYEEGDRIFFFGFSRGASTVRACNGMIAKCGLVKGQGLRKSELDEMAKKAYCAYKKHKKNPAITEAFRNDSEKVTATVPIKFLGVWDTVVALGFPKRTEFFGPFSLIFIPLFKLLEKIFDIPFPHSFYHYKLTDNVNHACQALAIDDERTAFYPHVWREQNIEDAQDRTPDNVEQVWFSGMHSNVGGGYARSGMAGISLYWMMRRAKHHGLMFNTDALLRAHENSHIHGRMYNSRDGAAILYRYHPREIEKLCWDKQTKQSRLLGNIKLHKSVIERMSHRTANYAPGHLPASFDVVDDEVPAKVTQYSPGNLPHWQKTRSIINRLVMSRKILYDFFMSTVLIIFGLALYYWKNPPQIDVKGEGVDVWLAKTLDYLTFEMFDGLIYVAIFKHSNIACGVILLFVIYYIIRKYLYKKTVKACENLRHIVIDEHKSRGGKSV